MLSAFLNLGIPVPRSRPEHIRNTILRARHHHLRTEQIIPKQTVLDNVNRCHVFRMYLSRFVIDTLCEVEARQILSAVVENTG